MVKLGLRLSQLIELVSALPSPFDFSSELIRFPPSPKSITPISKGRKRKFVCKIEARRR